MILLNSGSNESFTNVSLNEFDNPYALYSKYFKVNVNIKKNK